MLRIAPWPGAANVLYGFTGRAGGVSSGPFASLNLSLAVGDDDDSVRQNRDVLAAHLPPGTRIARLRQVHGATIRIAGADCLDLGAGDAAVTHAPGVGVAVLTADCVPILLCADSGAVVAAVHAGWRGTAVDIVGATVRTIADSFAIAAHRVEAVIGPAIGACCYEVGDEVVAALDERLGGAPADVVIRPTVAARARVDLRAANRHLLRAAGVPASAIREEGPCTRCAAQDYFSHRAAEGGRTGRQAAIIVRR